jgi:hypothetical protein
MLKAKLLKKMTVDGKDLQAGTIVDVSGWRNYRSLESMRYIAFIAEEAVVETPKIEKPKATKAKVEKTEEPAVQEIAVN